MAEKYDNSTYEPRQQKSSPPLESSRRSIAVDSLSHRPGVSVSGLSHTIGDERLLKQREPETLGISGVFEGTAGTGTDLRFVPKQDEEPHEQTSSAYEFFRGKSFKPINFEDGFAMNLYLGQEERTEFSTATGDLLPFNSTPSLRTGTTIKQLEAISRTRKQVELETPIERITRLQHEVTEMIDFVETFMKNRSIEFQNGSELAAAATTTPEEPSTDAEHKIRLQMRATEEARRFFGADPRSLLKELSILRSYLEEVVLSDGYQKLLVMSGAEGRTGATVVDLASGSPPVKATSIDFVKSNLEVVESLVQKASLDSKEAKIAATKDIPFTYELYVAPPAKDDVDTGRILELEKRLAELEENLGLGRGLHVNVPFDDISSALKEIVFRLSLLHPSRLDGLSKRFQSLSFQIEELVYRRERLMAMQSKSPSGATRDEPSSFTEEQAVSALYDFCELTRPAAAALPVIVKRLKALKILHQEAASLTSRLDALEAQQMELAKLLDTTQSHFDTLRDAVHKNILWAKEVVEELEK